MWVSAKQMLNVPSVTMKGGRLRPTTSPTLTKPTTMHVATPSRIAVSGGEDDERLADGQGADLHDLLDDQGEVRGFQELARLRREEDAGEHQGEQRAELRDPVAGDLRCRAPLGRFRRGAGG